MNVRLRSPVKKFDRQYRKSGKRLYLDRNYNSFFNFYDEKKQLEEFYHVDLKPLFTYNGGGLGYYKENCQGWLDWELSQCKTAAEKKQIRLEYKEKLAIGKEKDKAEFLNNWCTVTLMQETIIQLILNIQNNPDLLDKIDEFSYYFNKETFNMFKETHTKDTYYILSDFERILDFCNFLQTKGINKIAFYEA